MVGSGRVLDVDNGSEHDRFEDAVDSPDEVEQVFRKLVAGAREWNLDDQLKKNGEITIKHVNELRSWCEENGLLPDVTDSLLVAFLHCCRCDLELAKAAMSVYASVRSKTPEVFSERSYHCEEVQRAKRLGYFCVLPKKTPEGFRIMLQALRDPNPADFVYASSSKVQFLTMDAMVRAEPTVEGHVCLFDMQAVQMAHMWAWGFRLPRKIFKYLQEGLPLRMQRIHFLNTTPLMDRVMKMLRPLLRKEMASIFHFHTSNDLENLHKMIPPDCLPENYGGHLPPIEKLQGYTDVFLEEMDSLLQP